MTEIRLDMVYVPSSDIVAREIEGELIIIPLTPGAGDDEDELYTLNETGKEVWKRLDGTATLKAVAETLASEYEATAEELERDLLGLVEELCKRRILVALSAT
jgi:hypothetical protein